MYVFLYGLVTGVSMLYGLRKYRESKWPVCKNDIRLDEKIAIVTGANRGIGYEVTKELVRRGAFVICACRNIKAAEIAVQKIKKEIKGSGKMECLPLDLGCLESIDQFVLEVKKKYPKIHILVNNAGVYYPDSERMKTKDGFEIHIGVNHLGPFHLTNSLLDCLKDPQDPGRVIMVSSMKHEQGVLDLNDLNMEQAKLGSGYSNSKLANIYYGKQLAHNTQGVGVNIYNVSPGWVFTGLFKHHIKQMLFYMIIASPLALIFMRPARIGAQTIIYCATEPSLSKETGLLYRDCDKCESKVEFTDEFGGQLWDASEGMIQKVKNLAIT